MPSIEQSSTAKIDMRQFEAIDNRLPVPGTSGRPGSEPTFPSYPRFQVTSLPLSVIYQPDALRQFYRGGVPQSRIIPPQG